MRGAAGHPVGSVANRSFSAQTAHAKFVEKFGVLFTDAQRLQRGSIAWPLAVLLALAIWISGSVVAEVAVAKNAVHAKRTLWGGRGGVFLTETCSIAVVTPHVIETTDKHYSFWMKIGRNRRLWSFSQLFSNIFDSSRLEGIVSIVA